MKKTCVKRIISALMGLVVMCCITELARASEIMPIYENVLSATCSLTISPEGRADAFVAVTASGTDSLRGTIELKKYTTSGWENVATWSASNMRSIRNTYTRYVASGYLYKVFVNVDVFSVGGVYCETVSIESDEVYYG